MAAIEQAAGVSALFDANAQALINSEVRLNLHTELMLRAAEIIDYINAQEVTNE